MNKGNSQIKTGLIGCGCIGLSIAEFLDKNGKFTLNTITDINKENADHLLQKIKHRPKLTGIKNAILKNDLIIESASKEAVKEILESEDIDKEGKALIVMSSGGLFENLSALKKLKKIKIFIPSGAISGLDAIKSVVDEINYLKLITTKSSASLQSAPFVLRNKIKLNNLKRKKVIFNGTLKEAVAGFPKNINVAASLYLASGFENIKINIIADPDTEFNKHEIICKGKFGMIRTITKNTSSQNPKTSLLAILSALNILQNFSSNLRVGN